MTRNSHEAKAATVGRLPPASKCRCPGVCNCPNMPRCPRCGYTAHDASFLMDHRLCDGEIPSVPTEVREAKSHEKQVATAGQWRSEPYPLDGRPIYVLSFRLVKYTPYKPDGRRQMGAKGRWQEAGEYGGWENCPAPDGPWIFAGKTVPDVLPMAHAAPALIDALTDMLAGWRYIRDHHGDLYGVGWDRAQQAAEAALRAAALSPTGASDHD